LTDNNASKQAAGQETERGRDKCQTSNGGQKKKKLSEGCSPQKSAVEKKILEGCVKAIRKYAKVR